MKEINGDNQILNLKMINTLKLILLKNLLVKEEELIVL